MISRHQDHPIFCRLGLARKFLDHFLPARDTQTILLEYEDQRLQEFSVLAVWRLFTCQLLNLGIDIQIRFVIETGSTWIHGLSAPVNPERLKGRRDMINQIERFSVNAVPVISCTTS
jgi:hypothetical protein